MSDATHLLIPSAAGGDPGCRERLQSLRLPALEGLLARLEPDGDCGDGERTLSTPHELALARQCGLQAPDGLLPWAAWSLAQAGDDPGGQGCAFITPCHWQVGTDHIVMQPPEALHLDAAQSQALLAAMAPYFEQDGLRLAYEAPTRWIARGGLFAALPCASLDRVAGRVLDPWLPRSDAARPLRRLQQEMQMLLYTHPVNEERAAAGLPAVNSFWASGTGVLPPGATKAPPPALRQVGDLRDAAVLQDWAAWASAWERVDATECAGLRRELDAGRPVALTLCGERRARTWRAGGPWRRRLAAWRPRRAAADWMQDL